MTLDELRAEVAWLEKLDCCTNTCRITNERELRDYAYAVLHDEDNDLTRSEMRRIEDLRKRLEPPEERIKAERRAKRRAQRESAKYGGRNALERAIYRALYEAFNGNPEPWRPGQSAAVRARRSNSKRLRIIALLGKLTRLPKREPAGVVARRLGVSPRYVRKVLAETKKRNNPL